MSTFKVALTLCRKIDAVATKFWWLGSTNKNKFVAWNAWDSLQHMEDFNEALIAKLAWKIANGADRPWVNLLVAKYCAVSDFWDVEPKPGNSMVWKGILRTKLVLNGSCLLVGN